MRNDILVKNMLKIFRIEKSSVLQCAYSDDVWIFTVCIFWCMSMYSVCILMYEYVQCAYSDVWIITVCIFWCMNIYSVHILMYEYVQCTYSDVRVCRVWGFSFWIVKSVSLAWFTGLIRYCDESIVVSTTYDLHKVSSLFWWYRFLCLAYS